MRAEPLQPATHFGQDTVEQLLIDLVSIASPSHHEAPAVSFLVQWMRQHGYDEAFVDDAGSAVGVIGRGPREIVLLGHIDTFGASLPVRHEGRRLFGRGAVDAKGSLAAFAAAACQAALPTDLRVIVIGAVEEEAPTSKGARAVAARYSPDLCIIGEPSRWDRLTLGYKGRLVLEWRWEGPLAHSAGEAPSAAEQAVLRWLQIQAEVNRRNIGRERRFERIDVTLQHIATGADGIHGWAEMCIGFRLPPGVDPHLLAEQLDDGRITQRYGQEVAFVAGKDNLLSRTLRSAIRAHAGEPAFVMKTGTSDMNIVGPLWNCPILAYGPGDSALDHTPDEHINLDEYQRAVRILMNALSRL